MITSIEAAELIVSQNQDHKDHDLRKNKADVYDINGNIVIYLVCGCGVEIEATRTIEDLISGSGVA